MMYLHPVGGGEDETERKDQAYELNRTLDQQRGVTARVTEVPSLF